MNSKYNQPLTLKQIIYYSALGIVGMAIGFGLVALQDYLEASGIPSWILTICVILFLVWLYGAITKIFLIRAYLKTAEYTQTNISEIIDTPLNLEKLEEWSNALQILGFKKVSDFTIKSNSPVIVCGRLLIHEEHLCRAEIFQAFPPRTQQPTPALICAIGSNLTNGQPSAKNQWGLLTVNENLNAKGALEWALRSPRSLWSYHPNWSSEQLLSFHLKKRKAIAQANQLSPATGLSWEEYCRDAIAGVQQRRKRMLFKLGIILCLECWFCRNKTEWWGNYQKVMSQAV